MPNSTELKLVIHTSTVNSAHDARLPALRALAPRERASACGDAAALSAFTARSSTSVLASRAASAAAASASSATVLLPSAIPSNPPRAQAPRRGTDGANHDHHSLPLHAW